MNATLPQVLISIFFVGLFGMQSIAQDLPVIEAAAGRGQNVNWPQIQKEEDGQKEGPGFFYRDCSQGVKAGSASSTLKDQGGKNYDVGNLSDNNPMTAWVEGKPGYGIGEYFTVMTPHVNSIFNGYQATPTAWKNNSRVKKFKVYANGKPICYLMLKDEMGEQLFELPEVSGTGDITFKFEIADVYKGLKWDDVAISHVDYNACCFLASTAIELFGAKDIPVRALQQPAEILCIDLATNNTHPASTFRVASQIHLRMLEIKTEHHTITITPDHPLMINTYGFVSLEQLRRVRHFEKAERLSNMLEVMVWCDGQTHYEKIIEIKTLSGQYKTYTVKGLPSNSVYVADGFITTNY